MSRLYKWENVTIVATTLEIAFAEKNLRELCESEVKAKRILGLEIAAKLRRRLADIRAATSIRDLVVGNPRELEGNCPRPYLIELGPGARMILMANHNHNPVLNSGCIDWSKVSRVKILRIEYDGHA
jgi:plasmid maintenance system killer protein